jgi:hypothetical protein
MKFSVLLTLLSLLFIYKPAYSQNDTSLLIRTVSTLTKQAEANPVEKVYLHLDKPYYAPGDTIWFKAYTVLGENHKLSALSGVLYAELINESDSVVSRLVLQLDAGLANADFVIPDTYEPGDYHVRSYTNYMRNAGADYFFDQPVRIGPLSAVTASTKKVSKKGAKPTATSLTIVTTDGTDIRFFPEGGDLVTGVRSKVAIKVVSKNGSGTDVKGTVVDNEGNEAAGFETQHLGMGVFALIPQPGKTYKAKITGANGAAYTVDLPKAQEEGFTLAVNGNMGDSVLVKIVANSKLFATKQNSKFYLVAQSAGNVCYTTEGKLESPVFTTRISKIHFPTGIVQFTLFSGSGEPLNERVVFIRHADQLKLALTSAKKTYTKREKVKFDLSADDEENKTSIGTYSVAVTNDSRLPVDENAENTILSDLLLTSDLKGYIEMPNYYFTNVSEQTDADLDALMLTQGYRRFEWKKILGKQNAGLAFQPQGSLEINGTVRSSWEKPVAGGKVRLISIKYNAAIDTLTDANGDFKLKNVDLPDTAKIVITARDAKDKRNVSLRIIEPTYPQVEQSKLNSYESENIPQKIKNVLRENAGLDTLGIIRLQEVKIKGKLKSDGSKKLDKLYSTNLNGSGNADQILMGSAIVACTNLADCLAGKLNGVTFINGLPFSRRAMNRSINSGNTPMAVFVDGMQLDATYLNELSPDDIYSIEVLNSASHLAIYGTGAPNGALIITRKTGRESNSLRKAALGLITYRFKGFYKSRQFYSPNYDKPQPANSRDSRSTIYWNPDVITGKDGKASFEYFNADGKGSYRVVVQGIDSDGKLGYQVYNYKVE